MRSQDGAKVRKQEEAELSVQVPHRLQGRARGRLRENHQKGL